MEKGKFIVFEGGEGSGKSTQAKLLADYLRSQGKAIVLTKEPGGDDLVCKEIREILLKKEHSGKFSYRAELLLFEANRGQHVDYVVRPAVKDGKIVLCDRHDASTYAYQCGARNVCSFGEFSSINNFATGGLKPDFYFYLDIDPVEGLKRKKDENVETRFEKETLEFHQRVRDGFLDYLENHVPGDNWQKFDGSLPKEELHRQIVAVLKSKQLI